MKKSVSILSGILLIICLQSCDLLNPKKEDPNSLGGSADVPIGKVGNEFTTSVSIGDNYINFDGSFKVIKNENGISSVKITINTATLPNELKRLFDLYPSEYKDNNGNISTELKFKVTSEGIQDFMNPDGKAHTIVKYGDNVGDKYTLTRSDGKTITREITSKSTTDDFPYGMLLIKAMTVERNTSLPGVKKIVYKLNHKFGLVYLQYIMEDGTKANMYVFTKNY
jgi:hypothetical protein